MSRHVHLGRFKNHILRPICGTTEDALMARDHGAIVPDCPGCIKVLRREAAGQTLNPIPGEPTETDERAGLIKEMMDPYWSWRFARKSEKGER